MNDLIDGLSLVEGRLYKLVEAGKHSTPWVGMIFSVDSTIHTGHVNISVYHNPASGDMWKVSHWFLYRLDKYIPLSDEEALLYKMGE